MIVKLRLAPVLILLLFCFTSDAQDVITRKNAPKKAKAQLDEATLMVGRTQYEESAILLEKMILRSPRFIDPYVLLGDVYSALRKVEESKDILHKALDLNSEYARDKILKSLARLEKKTGNYDKAIDHLNELLELEEVSHSKKKLAQKLLVQCEFSKEAVANPVPFKPINMGIEINSKFDE